MKRHLATAFTVAVVLPLAAIALTVLAVIAEPGTYLEQLDGRETDYQEAAL